jgi:hypothetical protein
MTVAVSGVSSMKWAPTTKSPPEPVLNRHVVPSTRSPVQYPVHSRSRAPWFACAVRTTSSFAGR